jgi:hypothetical protein
MAARIHEPCGDQPVINARAKALEPPDEIGLYYPVSPKLSILVTQNASIGISKKHVNLRFQNTNGSAI